MSSDELMPLTPAEYRALISATCDHESYIVDLQPGEAGYAERRREADALTRLIAKCQAAAGAGRR